MVRTYTDPTKSTRGPGWTMVQPDGAGVSLYMLGELTGAGT